jgi:hypothetical protein
MRWFRPPLALFLISWLFFSLDTRAEVRISEFGAKNTRAFPDITDFEDYPDWIELENTGDTAVTLAGSFLSDNPQYPLKWAFPPETVVPAHGFLLVVADGRNTGAGQTFPRGYWPWRNFVTERVHTNFSLSSLGGALFFTQTRSMQSTPLVHSAASGPTEWRYLDDGVPALGGWQMNEFEDYSWKSGPAPLGYGDSVATQVGFGPDSSQKSITTYFRHRFTIPTGASYQSLSLKLRVDDGAAVYLNGVEVARRNLPEGELPPSSLATAIVGGADETTYFPYSVDPSLLRPGENVLAVEVHQCNPGSSDLVMDLSLEGLVATPNSTQSVSYGVQVADVSMGLSPENPSQWVQFAHPTPGLPNSGPLVADVRVTAPPVEASLPGGRYSTAQSVSLTTARGSVRYTLDGSAPTPDSPAASGPIPMSRSTILRARSFTDTDVPGPILTRTYLIDEPDHLIPVFSVVAPPDTLFGDKIGIYRNQHEPRSPDWNLSDVYKGKDAPGHVELFAPAGGGFHANCGIRIGGENNWVHPQKALNLTLSSKYGESEFRYALFPNSPSVVHASFTLRDGGDNWHREMLRDGLFPRLARGHLRVDTADYLPSVVYINGEYYGLHDIRERWDETWFFQKHHIPPGNVDHLLYGHVTGPTVTLGVEKGDDKDWNSLVAFLNNADLTQPAPWAAARARIDLQSFMDFVIAESYSNNTSWVHNREFWRERRPEAKWKWFLTDMDRTFNAWATTGVLSQMLDQDEVLSRLKNNPEFRRQLAQRFAVHMASTFAPARVVSLISEMDAEIPAGEIARHSQRWSTGNPSTSGMTASSRAAGIQEIKGYAQTRAANFQSELANALGVPAPVSITLAVSGNGEVLLEEIPVPPSTFKLFPGIAVGLRAVPAPGYRFEGWTGVIGGASVSVAFSANSNLQARFVPASETPLGGTLANDTTLSKTLSPYVLQSDLTVAASATLTIPAGVTLQIPVGYNLRIQGRLLIQGNASQPVQIEGRQGARWGGISFENTATQSVLSHVRIRGATSGSDPVAHPAAIAALNSQLLLEFLDIDDCENPVFCRGGSVILRDSHLRTPHSGDCINVKQGAGQVLRCTFYGNNAPDTDAIDFDGVVGGLIEDNRIYRFRGPNSDGIDIGEHCTGLLVQGNLIYFNSDKGISIGQGSDALLRRNLVVGCALGVGIKDSGSRGTLDQNSFIRCGTGVAAYEKNVGGGGGSAEIQNTLFAGGIPVSADALSSVSTIYCLSDSTRLPGIGNLVANPLFVRPLLLNFQLQSQSPAVDAGAPTHALDPDGSRADIGARYQYRPSDYPYPPGNSLVINEVYPHGATGWIELHNRSASSVNLGGWWLSNDPAQPGKFQFPPNTSLRPGAFLILKQHTHFGPGSPHPGAKDPFPLSPEGQSLFLSSTLEPTRSGYETMAIVPPLPSGISAGQHLLADGESLVFVAQTSPTPGARNSSPRTGPVVFSAIRSKSDSPEDADEFVELRNISNRAVTLMDPTTGKGWRIRGAIEHDFPENPPLTLHAGQRLILAKNAAAFGANFMGSLPPGTLVREWTTGSLKDGDEPLQLLRPNPLYASAKPTNQEEAAALFAGIIPVLNIWIPPAAMDQLRTETDWSTANSYVEVTLEENNGTLHEHVGLKLKGSVGSFQNIDQKPAFSINTDKYPGAKRFHGLDRFNLNNCAQDASALRELLAGELARKAGVPASRCTHAILKLNNERLLGIYVLKEGFSKDFLAPFFSQTNGRLYDGGFVSDIHPAMELDRGDPAHQERLLTLCNALDLQDDAARIQGTQAAVDVDAYLRYLCLENILSHWDGYSHNVNNYRLYENPATGKFHFVLHGMDQTWGGNELNWPPTARVGAALWSVPANQSKYSQHLLQIVCECIQPYDWNQRAMNLSNALQSALQTVDPSLAAVYTAWAAEGRNQIVERLHSTLETVLPGSAFGNASPAPTPPSPTEDSSSQIARYHLVDSVNYDHDFPWPRTTPSRCLIRIQESGYGDDPANWASTPVQLGNVRTVPLTIFSSDPTRGDVPGSLRGTTQHKAGTSIKVTALARSGMIFTGWTGSLNSRLNPLSVTLVEPLELTANFIPLPFFKGSFAGRLQNGAGSWFLSLTQTGSFSAQITLTGRTLKFKGTLDSQGTCTVLLPIGTLRLTQNLDPAAGGTLSGTLQAPSLDATLQSQPVPVYSRANPCPQAGQHTLVLLPPDASPASLSQPFGTSHAVLTVSTGGLARFAGSLADGSALLFSAPLAADRSLPLGVWIAKRRDTLSGVLAFSATPPETLSGSIAWIRPADSSAQILPWDSGFNLPLEATGSRWTPPARGSTILPELSGESILTLSGPDTLKSATVQFSTSHKVAETSIPTSGISFVVDPKTGTFTGKFRPSSALASVTQSFRGVFLKSQGRAEGYFLNSKEPEKSGRIRVEPVANP